MNFMKNLLFTFGMFSLLFMGSCKVEQSTQYKALLAKIDTLQTTQRTQHAELESLLAGINDINAGMQSLREAENLLALETAKDQRGNTPQGKIAAIKGDIQAIRNAIDSYKEQITKLERSGRNQSAELRKLVAQLNEELEKSARKIDQISAQLAEKERELAFKNQQITNLNENISNLQEETIKQKEWLAQQDAGLHLGHYLLGSRKNLRDAEIISRKGIFCPPIVSGQAQRGPFVSIDTREVKNIPLNSKKAKVLSIHPETSYSIVSNPNGMKTLVINDENAFWKQTRYLVVMINE